MDHLIRELVGLGLSEKEAAVYLALLEISPAAIQDIAEKADVHRATTYVLVDSLMKRGIVIATTQGKKQLFVAEPPERLVTILRLQRQELEEKEREFAEAIPMLNAIYNVKREKPQIRYFEGAEGMRTVRDLLMDLQGEYIQIVPLDDAEAIRELVEDRPEHYARLADQQAPMRGLFVMEEPDIAKMPALPYAEMRVVAASEFPVRAEITVRENYVLMFSFKPTLLSVMITSQDFADTLRALFNMAWKNAGLFPSKTTHRLPEEGDSASMES